MAISPEFPESQANGDLASPWSNPYYPTRLNIQYVDGWASTNTTTTNHWGYRTHTIDTVNRDWQISGWFDNTDVSGDGFIEIFFIDGSGDGYSLGVGNAYHLYPYSGGTRGSAFTNFDKTAAAYVPVYIEVTFEYATGEWRVYEDGVEVGNQVHTTHQAADKTTFGCAMYSDDSPTNESRWRALTIKDFIDVTGPPTDATATPATISMSLAMQAPSLSAGATMTPSPLALALAVQPPVFIGTPSDIVDGWKFDLDLRQWLDPTMSPPGWFDPAWHDTPTSGSSATASPATLSMPLTFPAVTPSADATATPALLALTLALLSATAQAGATVDPATLALLLALQNPTPAAGATPTPATLPLVLAPQAPAPAADSTAAPSTFALTLAIQNPQAGAGAIALPTELALALTFPATTPAAGATPTPATALFVLAPQAPDPSAGSTPAPATLPLTLTPQTPTTQAGATATPATLPLVLTWPPPSLSVGSSPAPATAQFSLVPQTPAPSAGSTVAPATLLMSLVVLDPSAGAGAIGSPATINLTLARREPLPRCRGPGVTVDVAARAGRTRPCPVRWFDTDTCDVADDTVTADARGGGGRDRCPGRAGVVAHSARACRRGGWHCEPGDVGCSVLVPVGRHLSVSFTVPGDDPDLAHRRRPFGNWWFVVDGRPGDPRDDARPAEPDIVGRGYRNSGDAARLGVVPARRPLGRCDGVACRPRDVDQPHRPCCRWRGHGSAGFTIDGDRPQRPDDERGWFGFSGDAAVGCDVPGSVPVGRVDG
jgi:hypothetical protein